MARRVSSRPETSARSIIEQRVGVRTVRCADPLLMRAPNEADEVGAPQRRTPVYAPWALAP